MDLKTKESFIFTWEKAQWDILNEKSDDGIEVLEPVLYVTEILGKDTVVLRWQGNKTEKQIEFPLLVPLDWIYDEMASDPEAASVWAIGTASELEASHYGLKGYHASYHQEDLRPDTILVCGAITPLRFLFEVILIADSSTGLNFPKSYLES